MIAARDGLATLDDPPVLTSPQRGRLARFRAGFRRRRGPLVRYWSAEFEFLGADPIKVEAWPAWAGRQLRRMF